MKMAKNSKHFDVIKERLDCQASVNSADGSLQLTIDDMNGSNLRFQLFNLDGKLLKSHVIDSSVINLSIGNCEVGPYFLKIIAGETRSELIRIFKR